MSAHYIKGLEPTSDDLIALTLKICELCEDYDDVDNVLTLLETACAMDKDCELYHTIDAMAWGEDETEVFLLLQSVEAYIIGLEREVSLNEYR